MPPKRLPSQNSNVNKKPQKELKSQNNDLVIKSFEEKQGFNEPPKVSNSDESAKEKNEPQVLPTNQLIDESSGGNIHTPTQSSNVQNFSIRSIFTSDEDTEKLEKSENGGIYVGRIHIIKGPRIANGSTVLHVGISNDSSYLVQLTGWGKEAQRLMQVIRHGAVIMCKGLRVIDKSDLGSFYFGSPSLERALKMTETSTINVVDCNGQELPPRTRRSELIDSTFENVINSDGPVRIQGYVKIPFREIETKKSEDLMSGVVTNDKLLLSVYIKGKNVPNNIHRGHKIEIIGELHPNDYNDKHHLLVASVDQIHLISGQKCSFAEIMEPYIHI